MADNYIHAINLLQLDAAQINLKVPNPNDISINGITLTQPLNVTGHLLLDFASTIPVTTTLTTIPLDPIQPAPIPGASVVSNNLMITKPGNYNLYINFTISCASDCVIVVEQLVDGIRINDYQQTVSTTILSGLHFFNLSTVHYQPDTMPHSISFKIRGDSTPVIGTPITLANDSIIFVEYNGIE